MSASALLLIAAAVFLRSALAAATFNPGVRTSDTVIVQVVNQGNRNAIVQAMAAEPSVAAVAAVFDAPQSAFAESGGGRAAVAYMFVSPESFGVLDVGVVRGRAFTPAERSSSLSVAIVSQAAADALWPGAEAVGQVMRLDPERASDSPKVDELRLESRAFTVVGVVRDVAGFRFAPLKPAVVYVPTSAVVPGTWLIARVHGDPERARQTLLNRLTTIDPDMARQVTTMRTVARMETYVLQIAFWSTVVLGGLALALTVSGLFGVLSYLVARRTSEIGVRMALGATARDVTLLILSQSIRPVGIGLVIGSGSAAGLAALLRATPAAATIGEIVHVFDPVAYAASLIVIIAACLVAGSMPAIRAARLDPTRALRQD